MNRDLIFVPVLIQVLLTLGVYLALLKAKLAAKAAGAVDLKRSALNEDAWPDSVRQINNNIRNQFEVPVLFYVLCVAIAANGGSTPGLVTAAWAYVGLRALHSLIHVTYNRVTCMRLCRARSPT